MDKTTGSPTPRLSMAGAAGKVLNGVLFNVSWLAILVTQSSSIALSIMGLHLLVHFLLMGKGRAEMQLIAIVVLAGLALDQLLFLSGVFNLAGASALAPLWLSCLWPVFATTLMHAFSSLQHRPYLASAIGAVGGALSYVAGTRLTDIEFGSPVWGPLVIGVLWAILFPVYLKLAARLGTTNDPLQSWEPAERRVFD